MPARCTIWLTPSRSGDQSAGRARSGMATRLDACHRGCGGWIARGGADLPARFGERGHDMLADEAGRSGDEDRSLRRGHCAPRAKRVQHISRRERRRARAAAHRRPPSARITAAIAKSGEQQAEQEDPRRHLRRGQPVDDGALVEMRAMRAEDRLAVDRPGATASAWHRRAYRARATAPPRGRCRPRRSA